MEILIFSANAVLPIVLLILLGYYLRQIGFLNENFLKIANTLVFRVALPVLLFYNVYCIESLHTMDGRIVLFALIMIFILFGLGLIFVKCFIPKPEQKGVILQCAFRSNYAIIGITLAESIGGEQAVGVAAVVSAFAIPLFNILAVVSLSLFVGQEKGSQKVSAKGIVKSIYHNPLIRGVVLGLVVLVIREGLPTNAATGLPVFSIEYSLPFLYKVIKSLSSMASPLALIVLGGQFQFSAVKHLAREITIGVIWRLVAAPAIGLISAICLSKYTGLVNFTAVDYPALIALFGSPTAVSSAIMSTEMGSDGELAGQLIVWSCLISIGTLFIITSIFKAVGIF